MLTEILIKLKMQGAFKELEKLQKTVKGRDDFAYELLQAEYEYRSGCAKKRRMAKANFPKIKEWVEIKSELNPKIAFSKIKTFSNGEFANSKRNLCLVGLPGTGKTHCLIAIGRDLCRNGHEVRFYTAPTLVNELEEAKAKNSLSDLMKNLQKPSLLIIDELGFVPFSENGARLLFDVFACRYERGSIAVSSNLVFEKWTQIFGSIELTSALIDRFTHKTDIFIFEGKSIRFLEASQERDKKRE